MSDTKACWSTRRKFGIQKLPSLLKILSLLSTPSAITTPLQKQKSNEILIRSMQYALTHKCKGISMFHKIEKHELRCLFMCNISGFLFYITGSYVMAHQLVSHESLTTEWSFVEVLSVGLYTPMTIKEKMSLINLIWICFLFTL